MISYAKGNILHINGQCITLALNTLGLGIELWVPNNYTIIIGQEISLFVYFNWNSENGPTLFGFLTEVEKTIFELVISCSGIGPKIGLAVLSDMQPKDFISAITNQDIKALSSVNGIGAKKAEQMIVQLKHKIGSLLDKDLVNFDNNFKHIKSVGEVLTSLNYSRTEVAKAIDHLKNSGSNQDYTFDQMLRTALSFLSKRA